MNNYTFVPSNRHNNSAFCMALLMIFTLNPWFTFFSTIEHLSLYMSVILAVLSYALSPQTFRISGRNNSIFIILFIAAMLGTSGNSNAFLGAFLRCIPFFIFLCAKSEFHITTLAVFNKLFGWIIGVSLFFWLFHLIGVPLPHSHLSSIEFDIYDYDNYYFFLRNTSYIDSYFPRFCSIFLEPGYIACFIVLLLFVDKFNFLKRQNIVYLAALVMTFSLAGWLFFLIAYIPYVIKRGQTKWLYLFVLALLIGFFLYLDNSSSMNAVNVMIGDRLKIENGELSGYNRVNLELKDYWSNHFWNSDYILFGLRDNYLTRFNFGASVDSRAYIIRYGILAMLAYVWFLVRTLRLKYSWLGLWGFIIVTLFAYRGYSIMFNNALLFFYVGALDSLRAKTISI